MHEVALVAELIDACQRVAAGRPVAVVRVRHASSLTEAALTQAFEMLTSGSSMSKARLETESFDMELACGACGFHGILDHDHLIDGSIAVCPQCGEILVRHRTAEIELLAVTTGD
jgi:Zn finger protein HypA/HybF involved in hydrogenase expression